MKTLLFLLLFLNSGLAIAQEIPTGKLGFPVGTYLRIEGSRIEGLKTGERTLLVDTINGKKLEAPMQIEIGNVDSLPNDTRCVLRGYETGQMIGTPPAVEQAAKEEGKDISLPQAGWNFHRYFVVISVVEPKDLARLRTDKEPHNQSPADERITAEQAKQIGVEWMQREYGKDAEQRTHAPYDVHDGGDHWQIIGSSVDGTLDGLSVTVNKKTSEVKLRTDKETGASGFKPSSKEEPGVRLYTDAEAETFRARLDKLKYPTTPQAACKELGIDLKRLTGKAGMMGSIDGRVGQSFAQLSGNYWISFQFQLYLQGSDGKVVQNEKGEYDKVSIYTLVNVREVQKKEDKVEVSIHDETLFVDAECPSGIGGARLALTSGAWPKKVVVRLKYAADKPFTNLEGPGATLEEKDARDEYLKVQRFPKKDGYEADIPSTERKTLYIHWVDAYRN